MTKVAELFSSEDRWTQGEGARDMYGKAVPFDSHNACQWCLLSAIYLCYPFERAQVTEERVKVKLFGKVIEERRLGNCLSVWNNWKTFEDVQKLVTRMKI